MAAGREGRLGRAWAGQGAVSVSKLRTDGQLFASTVEQVRARTFVFVGRQQRQRDDYWRARWTRLGANVDLYVPARHGSGAQRLAGARVGENLRQEVHRR